MGTLANTYDVLITICKDGRFFISASENTPSDLVSAIREGVRETIDKYNQQDNSAK